MLSEMYESHLRADLPRRRRRRLSLVGMAFGNETRQNDAQFVQQIHGDCKQQQIVGVAGRGNEGSDNEDNHNRIPTCRCQARRSHNAKPRQDVHNRRQLKDQPVPEEQCRNRPDKTIDARLGDNRRSIDAEPQQEAERSRNSKEPAECHAGDEQFGDERQRNKQDTLFVRQQPWQKNATI